METIEAEVVKPTVKTPEEKPRTKEQIQQEYNNLAAQLGERQFKINVMKEEIIVFSQKMMGLNQEMMMINKYSKG